MVWHYAPGQYPHRDAFLNVGKYLFESQVVASVIEDPAFTVRAIEHVINVSARRGSEWPRHATRTHDAADRLQSGLL